MQTIPPNIRLELVPPELGVRGARYLPKATAVPMPETAVNEYHLGERREDEVGFSRKIANVKPVSIPHAVDE